MERLRENLLEWMRLFDHAESCEEWLSRGSLDLHTYHLTPQVLQLLGVMPHRLTALDIGCGGGRMVISACKVFDFVYGVDTDVVALHEARSYMDDLVGVHNFKLEESLRHIPENSIDFVYSQHALQHFTPDELFDALDHIRRVLSPRGVASLLYGHLESHTIGTKFLEDAPPNYPRLRVPVETMISSALYRNMKIHLTARAPKYPWSLPGEYGLQSQIILSLKDEV
jgi:SAM-dependent methyltransferase